MSNNPRQKRKPGPLEGRQPGPQGSNQRQNNVNNGVNRDDKRVNKVDVNNKRVNNNNVDNNNVNKRVNNKKKKVNFGGPNRCRVCNGTGHWAAECPHAYCKRCGQKGHTTNVCNFDDFIHASPDVSDEEESSMRSEDLSGRLARLKVDGDDGGEEAGEFMSKFGITRSAGDHKAAKKSIGSDGAKDTRGAKTTAPPPVVDDASEELKLPSVPTTALVALKPGLSPPTPPPPPPTMRPYRAVPVVKRTFREPDEGEFHDQQNVYISQFTDRSPVDKAKAVLTFIRSFALRALRGVACMAAWHAVGTLLRAMAGVMRIHAALTHGTLPLVGDVAARVLKDAALLPQFKSEHLEIMRDTMARGFTADEMLAGVRQRYDIVGDSNLGHLKMYGHLLWEGVKMNAPTRRTVVLSLVSVGVVALAAAIVDSAESWVPRSVSYSFVSSNYEPSTTDMRPTSQKAREGFYADALIATYLVVDVPAGWRGLMPEVFGYTIRRLEKVSMELFISLTEARILSNTDTQKVQTAMLMRSGVEDRIYTNRYDFGVHLISHNTAAFAWHYYMSRMRGLESVFW